MSIANAAHCSMMGGGKALPYEFLDYVYTNGTAPISSVPDGTGAYIDTGITPYGGIDIHCEFQFVELPKSNRTAIFGAITSDVFNRSSLALNVYSGGQLNLILDSNPTIGTKTTKETVFDLLDGTNWTLVVNGITTTGTVAKMSNGVGHLYYGCTYYQGSNGPVWLGKLNLGKLTIKDSISQNAILDLRPCKRIADNVYGFYDALNDAFIASRNNIPFGPRQ